LVKDKHLYPLNIIAKNLMAAIDDCKISHKLREENKRADSLAKKAAKLGKKGQGRGGSRTAPTSEGDQKTLFD